MLLIAQLFTTVAVTERLPVAVAAFGSAANTTFAQAPTTARTIRTKDLEATDEIP
jgi:hypothetical protein